MTNDISLVKQVAVFHNKQAYDQLVRKYQSPVRRFLLNLTLGNGALSDDLAQDTFLKAYTSIGQFRGTASFQTWLMRIAYNTFYDYKRKASHSSTVEIAPPSGPEGATTEAPSGAKGGTLSSGAVGGAIDVKMDVRHALSLLKDEERTCITLQMIDGEPIDQIATITGMPENTVKSHLRRGKARLADYLRQNGYG